MGINHKIKAIIFDLDGVVVDSEKLHEKSIDTVLKKNGIEIQIAHHRNLKKELSGKRMNDVWEFLKDYFKIDDTTNSLLDQSNKEFFVLLEEQMKLMKDFEKFLDDTKNKYRTALTTSGRRPYIERLEKKFSISKYFDVIIIGDDVKNGKPDPESYLLTCKKLRIKPEEAVVIEDTPNGIKAAKAAGCVCIAVTFTFSREHLEEADFIADSYKDIEKIIEGLE